MKTRITALIIILALCISLFAGCGNNGGEANVTPSDVTAPSESTDAPDASVEPTVLTTFDYEAAYAAYEPDAVVLTVNGNPVTWAEYFSWIYSMVEQYEMYLGTEFAWTDPFSETQTIEEYTKLYAETLSSQYSVVNNLALENGIELTDEEKQHLEDIMAEDAANYANGSVEDFIAFLESTYMTEEYYNYINAVSVYYQKLYTFFFGENGEKMIDEDVHDFIDTNGYLYAKHILLLTTDESGTALDEAAKAEKLALAEDILAQINAVTDPEDKLAKFDELMMEHSEDKGLAAKPDGYYFLPGEMVSEFENGTKALGFNEISEIIESPYGYHIILRMPITPESEYQPGTTFRALASAYAYDTMMGENFSSAEIVYSDEFASLSFGDIFTAVEVEN